MIRGPKGYETLHLYLTAAVILVLVAYWVGLQWADSMKSFFLNYTTFPVAPIIMNGLFVCLVGLLWFAYHRWRDALRWKFELERIISSISPDVLLVVEPDRTIRMCNNAAHCMFGYEAKELIGQKTDKLYSDRRTTGVPNEIYDCLQRYGFHIGEAKGRHANGHSFPLEIVTGDLKGCPGAVILIRDLTRRKAIEQQLTSAKNEAEKANHAKSEALARLEDHYVRLKHLEEMRDKLVQMIVHDLKSPLFTVNGYLDLLKMNCQERLTEAEMHHLNEASRLGRSLIDMANSLLDVSRLERREMPLNIMSADLALIAQEAVKVVSLPARYHNLTVDSPEQPVVAPCDPEVIRRVIINLVGNALKFTPEDGEIRIGISCDDHFARVLVKDNGIGIAPEHHTKIFEPFGQVQARRFSTGLGLTFCKLAIEAHGGTISVVSTPSKGSTFSFDLPLQRLDTVSLDTEPETSHCNA
jgi:PAS domain S-box-containing protein